MARKSERGSSRANVGRWRRRRPRRRWSSIAWDHHCVYGMYEDGIVTQIPGRRVRSYVSGTSCQNQVWEMKGPSPYWRWPLFLMSFITLYFTRFKSIRLTIVKDKYLVDFAKRFLTLNGHFCVGEFTVPETINNILLYFSFDIKYNDSCKLTNFELQTRNYFRVTNKVWIFFLFLTFFWFWDRSLIFFWPDKNIWRGI